MTSRWMIWAENSGGDDMYLDHWYEDEDDDHNTVIFTASEDDALLFHGELAAEATRIRLQLYDAVAVQR